MNEVESELDRQWSARYTQDIRKLEIERDTERTRADVLRLALSVAIKRLQTADDRRTIDLVRVLDEN